MSKRKEYNNRWEAPLVNPAFTEEELAKQKQLKDSMNGTDTIAMADYFKEIEKRSEK